MSAESQGRADVVGLHVAFAGASEPLSRLVAFSRAIAAEKVSQRMLRIASRHLTTLLNAKACLVSQVEDGLLREVADYACSTRQVARGLSYYLTDYPTTASVLMTGKLCSISADDPGADPAELFVLREMDMQAVLLVPIVVEGRGWGLIEVYDTRSRVFSGLERHLAEVAATQLGSLLASYEHEERAQRLYGETLRVTLERPRGQGCKHRPPHRRGRQARSRRCDRARARARCGAQRRARRRPPRHRQGAGPGVDPQQAGTADPERVGDHEDASRGRRAHPPADPVAKAILPIVRHHHERWDGAGYPDGLAGRAIPLGARIVAVCDAYRAMSEDRPYRSALSEDDARDELERGAGDHFDADCVAALLRALDRRDHTATVVALRPPGSAASAPHRRL